MVFNGTEVSKYHKRLISEYLKLSDSEKAVFDILVEAAEKLKVERAIQLAAEYLDLPKRSKINFWIILSNPEIEGKKIVLLPQMQD